MNLQLFGSEAMLGYGSKFQKLDAGHWVDLAEVNNISGPDLDRDDVDVTHMQSPDAMREFIAGLGEAGEFTVTGNFIPRSDSQRELLADFKSRAIHQYRVLLPDAVDDDNKSRWVFDAFVQSLSTEKPTDDKMEFTAAFKISGSPLLTDVTAADMTALVISEGTLTPAFSATTYQYVATVINTTDSLTVTPTCAAADTILVNGIEVDSGVASSAISLDVGMNTIIIEIIEGDIASNYYTITVGRESA